MRHAGAGPRTDLGLVLDLATKDSMLMKQGVRLSLPISAATSLEAD
jgi:hypothetical protein